MHSFYRRTWCITHRIAHCSSRCHDLPRHARTLTTTASLPDFQSVNCLITGASRGIGHAIALSLARAGASCHLIGRNSRTLQTAAETIRRVATKERPGDAEISVTFTAGDVGDRALWEETLADRRDLDVLVNAAGVSHSELLVRAAPERVEETVRTNLMGTVWACKYVARRMMTKRRGREGERRSPCIVNVASTLGLHGGKGAAVYAASKAGVLGLTRALATELGPAGIRVNAIVPGYIDTEMTRDLSPEARAEALSNIPLKRFGTVEEVAEVALFLVSNQYANNCVVNLDGGMSAG